MNRQIKKISFMIEEVAGQEVLDSRGNPTVLVTVRLKNGACGSAIVPSGASTGRFEAVELRDGDKRYGGKGVAHAVANVNTRISDRLCGMNALEQGKIDKVMRESDGTENKAKYGANAILGVSLAVAKAAAEGLGMPLYRYIGGVNASMLPVPMMNILNGGVHASNTVDFQEFMIMPIGLEQAHYLIGHPADREYEKNEIARRHSDSSDKDAYDGFGGKRRENVGVMGNIRHEQEYDFSEGIRKCVEIYQQLKTLLNKKGYTTGVGDEGGFAPDLSSAEEVFDILCEAIRQAGYEPGKDICFAMDSAASELYDSGTKRYYFPGESQMKGKEIFRNSEEMVSLYEDLVNRYPIISIEDGLDQEDYAGWKVLTYRLGREVQLVGDDLFVTNTERLKDGITQGMANAILIKPNQIGTLTETLEAIRLAQKSGYNTIISHRSGDTEDTTIADIAVAVNAGQIKTGAPCRAERTSKYNRLLKIEQDRK